MKTAALLKIFIAIAFIYLALLFFSGEDSAWFMKPLLLPAMMSGVLASEKFPTKNLLIWALVFSWFGDVVLMFADKGQLFFIIGLLLFLTAHMIYILLFNKQQKTQNSSNNSGLYIGVVFIVGYLFVMLFVLYPKLGGLKIPVTVYAMVISMMLFMALKGFFGWQNPANYYVLTGAICFVVSDSLLAFNKFYEPIQLATFNIMSTYLLAQFLIVFGLLVLNKKQHSVLSENAAI